MSCKTVSILGSTGSIGVNALDLIAFHADRFRIAALTGHRNAERLIAQAMKFRPEIVAIGDENFYGPVRSALPKEMEVVAGQAGILEAASREADLTVAGIVGMDGLKPLLASMKASNAVAIANKEPLVAAGDIVIRHANETACKILPIDSEHNAIFQVLEAHNADQVRRLILTASGGPFRDKSYGEMRAAKKTEALRHPNWTMGAKITIDSATMMNKGLEIIEAHHLFSMPAEKIDVLIHPQSIVHSMVEYADGSTLAQLGAPDMRTPIAHALAWPERMTTSGESLDWTKTAMLEFRLPDAERFPSLRLAYAALRAGNAACIALNAANEIAVGAFLEDRIRLTDIAEIVEEMLETVSEASPSSLDETIALDADIRRNTAARIAKRHAD
jgi:1-deoxy-D-xylulose-5-phosphate reductoisomerase